MTVYKHRHTIGTLITEYFVAKVNSDQTEGRGGMIDKAYSSDVNDAYHIIKGEGVMGVGDGDIALRQVRTCGGSDAGDQKDCTYLCINDTMIYNGHNKSWADKYDPRKNDPEWAEFQRLTKKFEEII